MNNQYQYTNVTYVYFNYIIRYFKYNHTCICLHSNVSNKNMITILVSYIDKYYCYSFPKH